MWDKKGENLAFKWFRMLSEQNQDKLAIIVGDSQTAYSGRALQRILKRNGYEVIRNFKAGENTNKTIQRLSTISPDRPVSLVVVFTGGNNPNAAFSETATANLIELIRRKFGEGVEIVIGAAPPARTGDPARVKKVFGRSSHSESYKAKRKAMADAIVSTANSMGVKAVNPHTAGFLDDDVNTGDGIHLTGSDAQNFAEAVASQVTGKTNVQAPISAVIKDFSGKRLATSKLRGLDLVQLARYAKSRASACQGMGYFTIGSKGDKVKQIQDRLAELGLNPPTKDEDAYGTFDLRTLYNIIAFQKMSKIRTDGCVGPETAGALGMKQAFGGTSDETPEERAKIFSQEKKDTVKRYSRLIRSIPSDEISYKYGDVPADMFPKVIDAIETAAEKNGIDLDIMLAMAIYESGFNPYARTPLSSAAGLYAFLKSSGTSYGLQNYPEGFYDPGANADAAARMINNNISTIEKTTGRPMNTDDEYLIYVAHQQGPAGMRNIYRSAQRGLSRVSSSTVHNNIMNQGSYLRGIYMKGGPKAFLDFYKNKFSRTKSLGRQIANAVKTEQVAE